MNSYYMPLVYNVFIVLYRAVGLRFTQLCISVCLYKALSFTRTKYSAELCKSFRKTSGVLLYILNPCKSGQHWNNTLGKGNEREIWKQYQTMEISGYGGIEHKQKPGDITIAGELNDFLDPNAFSPSSNTPRACLSSFTPVVQIS